jgi:hypothetical protein
MTGHFERFEDSDTAGEQTLPRPPASVTLTQIWDIGPRLNSAVPKEPDHTATPAEWEDYETDVAHHVALVLKYRREKAEFDQKYEGPVKIETDAVSAREMIERGDGRYVSALPAGLMPGVRIDGGQ